MSAGEAVTTRRRDGGGGVRARLRRARRGLSRSIARAGAGRPADAGSAVVEFLGVSLLLLVPLVYLVLTLGRIQAAAFAAEGAAREAGRVVVSAASFGEGVARARAAADLAFADQGIEASGADAVSLACEADPCLEPGARILVDVAVRVGLPGVPAVIRSSVPTEIPVSAQFVAVVDEFREVPT